MKKVFLFTLLSLFCFPFLSFSQSELPEIECAQESSPEDIAYELNYISPQFNAFLKEAQRANRRGYYKKTVNIKVHIVRNSNGTGGISSSTVTNMINAANAEYLTYYYGSIYEVDIVKCGSNHYINSSTYYTLSKSELGDLRDDHDVDHTINVYFVGTAYNSSGSGVCGYAKIPGSISGGTNYVIMDKDCPSSTFVHELGHALGLYHTHTTTFGKELVTRGSGANCATAGDRFCDTPADPKLSTSVVNSSCNYTGSAKDSNGATYVPNTRNIMSYSRKSCRTLLSPSQVVRVYNTAHTYVANGNCCGCSTPNPGTGGGRLSAETIMEDVGIAPLDFNYTVFPNPASDRISVLAAFDESQIAEGVSFDLLDMQGRIVRHLEFDQFHGSQQFEMDLQALPAGMYTVLAQYQGKRYATRFVKQ